MGWLLLPVLDFLQDHVTLSPCRHSASASQGQSPVFGWKEGCLPPPKAEVLSSLKHVSGVWNSFWGVIPVIMKAPQPEVPYLQMSVLCSAALGLSGVISKPQGFCRVSLSLPSFWPWRAAAPHCATAYSSLWKVVLLCQCAVSLCTCQFCYGC